MNKLENQVAIVTGAGRGIGQAIATRLASEGAKIAVVSRTEANSEKTAAEINATFPGAARAYAVDVADAKASAEVCARILQPFQYLQTAFTCNSAKSEIKIHIDN